jgi:hypothetical protein
MYDMLVFGFSLCLTLSKVGLYLVKPRCTYTPSLEFLHGGGNYIIGQPK